VIHALLVGHYHDVCQYFSCGFYLVYSQCYKVNKKSFTEKLTVYLKINFKINSIFTGRYAIRYGKVATETLKKGFDQIPGGLVSNYLLNIALALYSTR